jgi:hypothetical protein
MKVSEVAICNGNNNPEPFQRNEIIIARLFTSGKHDLPPFRQRIFREPAGQVSL